jgi:DNA invertase Pin-like site-specific DNA recombinase
MTDPRIAPRHLDRRAVLYIRQSSPQQVLHHHESRRLQYAMEERLRSFGWREVEIIDDDLGHSAAPLAPERTGFQALVAQVCLGQVGAIAAREIARLARNNKDWAQLIEMCRLLDTLLVDVDIIYDARCANDRLLLGVKGSLSEYELDLLRIRAHEARQAKAARGELLIAVPVGYLKVGGRIEKDPDRRLQQALTSVFTKFLELGTARQTLLWFVERNLELPVAKHGPKHDNGLQEDTIWKRPSYRRVLDILKNPTYAGAYAYGKTAVVTDAFNGAPRRRWLVKPREQWSVLIPDHHEGYISWDVYQRIQRMLSENRSRPEVPGAGAAKRGPALLAGLLRCRRCGRKLRAAYSGPNGDIPRYQCDLGAMETRAPRCISFGGQQVDASVVVEMLRVVQPAAIEAAILAADRSRAAQDEVVQALELELKAAKYEADRARSRYDAVDPANRLVADELESRWNAALVRVRAIEQRIALETQQAAPRAGIDRDTLLRLADDLDRAWNDPHVTPQIKKRLLRCVIHEIVVDVDDAKHQVILIVHWVGGIHTELHVGKRRRGENGVQTAKDLVEAVRLLALILDDDMIAGVLNKNGFKTGRGNRWNQERVKSVRSNYEIAVHETDPEQPTRWMALKHAAAYAKLSPSALRRAAQRGEIPSQHPLPEGPWIFDREALEGGFHRVIVDKGLIALVRFDERRAQQLCGDAGQAAARAEEQLAGRIGQQGLCGARGFEGVIDQRAEGLAIEGVKVDIVGHAHRQGRVRLQPQMPGERRQPDEPQREQIPAVEGEVEEAGQIEQERIREMLRLVEDDHRRDAALVDQMQQRLLDRGPELGAAVGGPQPELHRQRAIEIEGRYRRVAEIEDQIVRFR